MNLLVNIDVPDLERAIAFYTSAFGLKVARRFGTSGVELTGGTSPIYLLPKDQGTKPGTGHAEGRRTYDRHWTPVHLDVEVKDIGRAVKRAESVGARLEVPISTQRWGKLALMADPFGHGFCLIQFQGRGYDELTE
jgi:predicted enzyme related to lactoylglutathione lyase